MVANEFWIHPRGLIRIPGKDVNVLFKELYQLLSLSCWGSWDPIWKNFSGSSPIVIFTRSSHFASSAGLSMDSTGGFNCYNSFSLWVIGSASGLCQMAITMHCRATAWSPNISTICPLDGYLTFWCRVEKIAPKVWSQGLATIAV